MKLGIINGWSEGCIKYVHDKGLEAVEFCVNDKYDSNEFLAQAQAIKGYSEKYGVAVGSIGRWGMDRIDDNGDVIPEALQHDKNLITAASIIGCPVYNCGINYTDSKSFFENCEIAINYFKTLVDFAKDKNVKIASYNCDWANFVIEPKVWEPVLSAVPELGLKYDASHCLRRGGNYLKEMLDFGDRIYHFHLKGSVYIDGEHYDDAPAGLDQTDWKTVMDILYTKNYDGMLSIEPHSSYWEGKKGQWAIDYTINYFRPFIMPEDYEYSDNPYMP
ncbi:MAG: sugar phosphate isomerase/epimerase [Clostridia bacterium]|nr:sugar phosphate isomerase/epimerase [Clostridia bacterium]MBQ7046505.1 sugar phosphate isomerase/epimerase [Oscillospiraceae bacterium]